MKSFLLIAAFLIPAFSHAGYKCQTVTGDQITISNLFPFGLNAKVESKAVTAFYKDTFSSEIIGFVSTFDPETKGFLTKENEDGFLFGLQAVGPQVENIWSLSFELKPNNKALGILMDLEGNGFEFDLTCTQTPDLE